MTQFQYIAFDVDGKAVKNTIEAVDEAEARQQLLHLNLDVRSVNPYRSFWRRDIGGSANVKPVEILHFSRQMAAFVRSGMSVVDGLDVISRSTNNAAFAKALQDVRDQVRQGAPFDDALAEHSNMLPRYYMGVVRSASHTGRLDDALDQLASYMERELDAKGRIKAAMAYPVVIISMAMVSVVVLTVWVLPKFVSLFKELDAKLPWTTRSLINFADYSQTYWYMYFIAMAAFIGLVMWTRRTDRGRRTLDHVIIRLPLVGEIALYAGVERVCRILSTMWAAGVPIGDAMTAAIQSADNAVFEERLLPVQAAVLSGEGLIEPLRQSNLFPAAAVQMLEVGEETGTLAQQLENAANFYSHELDYKLKRLTTLFEPAIIVVVGLVVGFVALALVDAMYGSLNGNQLK